jgi:3-oxoacyl-[acyl-carrier protein] reductase
MGDRVKGPENRVILVTGGARGIGAAIGERFAEGKIAVALCDLDAASAAATAREIGERYGVHALGLACDIRDAASVNDMVERVASELGSLDILVNNAGVTRDNLIHKLSDQDWDDIMLVHLRGSFLCARAAQRHMVKRGWGRIINMSSTSALGNRGQVNYSTAKAGLQGMTRSLALELGQFGITVNCIAPGFIDTEMTRQTAIRIGKDPEEYKKERAKGIAVRRVGVPRDIASLAFFLAGDEASFLSGQVIYASGGPETRRGG